MAEVRGIGAGRWYGLQASAALQLGGADVDVGAVGYLGWARGLLDPDRDRPATEESPFWGVGLALVTSACTGDGDDPCPGRTSLGPAVRAGIAWIELPWSVATVYVQASGLLGHEHGREGAIQGAGFRGSVGYSLPLLAGGGSTNWREHWLLLLLSHGEVSFETFLPPAGRVAHGFGIGFGLGF